MGRDDTTHGNGTKILEQDSSVTLGKIPKDKQLTDTDTCWSEETKELMRRADFDDLDIHRGSYS